MEPAGPAFEAELEAFLAVTGTKRSVLGSGAVNNPSLVTQLEDGVSPTLRTVAKVRAWMAKHANPAEARAIRRRMGPMPEFLPDKPRRSSEAPAAPLLPRIHGQQGSGDRDDEPFIDTEEAAVSVGLVASTLARYRSTGGDPPFYRFPERLVRYRREHLAEWEAARWR